MWYCCLYKVQQAFGGPEEGGWHYDCGEPHPLGGDDRNETTCQFFLNREDAKKFKRLCQTTVDELNKGLPHYSSSNSDGKWEMVIGIGIPKNFPQERPHYE